MKAITFYKYVKAYHVDLAFTRAKEDCCDTCIRLEIAAADPNLDNEERWMHRSCTTVMPGHSGLLSNQPSSCVVNLLWGVR
jgi:hypothetical protein